MFLSGCAASADTTVYLHPLADLSLVKRIGVLPLENLATLPNAGTWVQQILTTELLAQGYFDVIEPWEVKRALAERQFVDPQGQLIPQISPEELAELAQALDSEALLLGTVLQFERARYGTLTAPQIGLSLRLVDAQTGLVIWSATDSRSGVSFGDRLIGADGPDLTAATAELVRSLLSTLAPP